MVPVLEQKGPLSLLQRESMPFYCLDVNAAFIGGFSRSSETVDLTLELELFLSPIMIFDQNNFLNHNPSTLNHEPQTLNPKMSNLNAKPCE